MNPATRTTILRLARLRQESGGAILFIVAVTLALLASMGIYGLTSTANDISAAGNLRQATQGQHMDEGALMAAAESFTPGTASQLVRDMVDPSKRSNQTATPCKSANPPNTNASTQLVTASAEACLRLTESQMATLASLVNPWTGPIYSPGSFGSVPQAPFMRVEVTNPIEVPGPAGNSSEGAAGAQMYFAQVTATVYVDMKLTSTSAPDSTMLGRGRFTVGPYRR